MNPESKITLTPTLSRNTGRGSKRTLFVGLTIIVACEILLFIDVRSRSRETFALPRFVAVNMTAFVWPGYILLLDGLLAMRTGSSPPRKRPHHFATLCLASILIWCLFDWINFYFIHAWSYVGVPAGPFVTARAWAYVLAFGCVVPGMLMTGQLVLDLRWFDRACGPTWNMPKWLPAIVLLIGIGMFLWPLIARDPVTNYTLWTSLLFLLDPINYRLGRPSVLRDWQNGWYGRTLACFSGGLICGLLWEFWNYWAIAKWVYHLPFLGALEHVRYFEMPLLGLLGFIPFGLECWVMWQTIRIPLEGMVEPLTDERNLI